jgi:hypothetical protein
MATVFTVNAQDKKPTKEQTILFIKSEIEGKIFGGTCYAMNGYYSLLGTNFSDMTLELKDCNLIFRYKYEAINTYNYPGGKADMGYKCSDEIDIDLSKIETVKAKYMKFNDLCSGDKLNYKIVLLALKLQPGYKKLENCGYYLSKDTYYIPVGVINCDECDDQEINKKIKAFNHLRKLCGAPDPISFD